MRYTARSASTAASDYRGFTMIYDDAELIDENGCPEGWDCIEGDDVPDFYAGNNDDADSDEAEDRIEDNDWVTHDGNLFYEVYEGGSPIRLVLDTTGMPDKLAKKLADRVMTKAGFYPNVWFVSDHGNLHRFTF
jgi:hypothetical protein